MSTAPPNILWIFCDELRTDAVGVYGNEYAEIETPHIDRIAEAGASFDRFHVSSPVCVSSRAAFKTGLLPFRTGIYHNTATELAPPVAVESLVTRFRDAGYVTVNLGKEHVPEGLCAFDESDEDGAEQFELMVETWNRRDELGLVTETVGINAATWPVDTPYPADRLTDAAQRWLHHDRPDDRPWLLRVSYLQPHTPVVVPEPWASRYDDQPWPDQIGSNAGLAAFERSFATVFGAERLAPQQLVAGQSRYHGVVAWIDEQVGALLATLDELSLHDDTIVVFASDHGCQLGELGGAFAKQTFSPWSHRVPFMLAWPGTIPAGVRRSDLAHGVDLGPTLLELAGLAVPEGLDGRRLFSDPAPAAITGAIGYGDVHSFGVPAHDKGRLDGRGWPQRVCVRTDRWRYERSTRQDGELLGAVDGDRFLADSVNDPREERNLIDDPAHAAVVDELESVLAGHLADAVQIPPATMDYWWTERERRRAELFGSR